MVHMYLYICIYMHIYGATKNCTLSISLAQTHT